MILVGAAVLVAVRMIYSRVGGHGDDQVRLALRVMGWVMLAVGLLAAMQLLMGQTFGVLFWIIVLLAIGNMAHRYRQSEKTALLWILAIAAERQMPLVPSVEAFASEWGGMFGRHVQNLAAALGAGVPLPDALDRQPALLPGEARVAARMGVESGMLGPVLREAVLNRTSNEPLWQSIAAKAYYLLVVLFLAQVVTTFMAVKIVPRMQLIMADFGTAPSMVTQWTFDVLDNSSLAMVMIIAVVIELGLLLYLLAHFLGWIPWALPLVDRLLRRADLALVLRWLAWMTERQRPIGTALLAIARSHHKAWVRRRLRRADLRICEGVDWCTALRREGLLSAGDAAVLAAAERAGNLPWAMRAMAESGERRLMHRLQVVVLLVYPLLVAALGAFVFVFSVAFLLPLFQMIERTVP
jgi:type II secretory pathway component PulF